MHSALTEKNIELYDKYVMKTYPKADILFTRGSGCHLWDGDGNEYLDFAAGIAVCSLGHCHPAVTRAIVEQAQKLVHVSNLFMNERQPELASKLISHCFDGVCFFCNSGAEANEALIKLARKWGSTQGRYEIIAMNDSFRMTADIDLGNQPWTAIGKYNDGSNANRLCFNGNFDGDGHCILNLNAVVPDSSANRVGLFGTMLTGSVFNLGIESGTVNVSCPVGGGIVAEIFYSGVRIENCYNNATIRRISDGSNGSMMRMGGIVGVMNHVDAQVTNCVNYGMVDASVSGSNNNNGFGGICGLAQAGTLSNCYNLGKVNGGFCWAGGLIGFATSANVKAETCASSGLVYTRFSASGTSNTNCAGGYLVGKAMAAPTMTNCVAYTLAYEETGATLIEDGKTYYLAEKMLANGDVALVSGTVNSTDRLNPTAQENAPVMQAGAGVRLVKNSSGLRFLAKVSAKALAAAESQKDEGTEVMIGTLICPADLMAERSTLTHRTLNVTGTLYQDVSAKDGLSYDADGNAIVKVALVDITPGNYGRSFAARTYISFIRNGETVYVYADYAESDNARSITTVAQAAFADIRTEQNESYAYAVDGGFSPYNSAEREVLKAYLILSD